MHSSRMRTARSSSRPGGGGGVSHNPPWDQAPLSPREQTPPSRPPPQEQTPAGVGLEIPLNFPLGCGPGESPGQIPLNFPLVCGPGDSPLGQIPLNFPPGPGNLQGMLGYHPPWRPAARHACTTCNACWDSTPHLWTDRHL